MTEGRRSMSEERKTPGAELSEAELANVSGAHESEQIKCEKLAMRVCHSCSNFVDPNGKYSNRCSGRIVYSLAEYLLQNGKDSVTIVNYRQKCPYLIK